MNYVTVNPCKTCQPLGAILAFRGIEGAMTVVHGSQGCSTYMRLHLTHHFAEPIDVASSALNEKDTVYGGAANLKLALKNVLARYKPALVGIATTCLTETIGDDVDRIVNEFKAEEQVNDVVIIPVSTPSYTGAMVDGFNRAIEATLNILTEEGEKENCLAVIPAANITPAEIREIKRMTGDFAPFIFFPDYADTLDAPFFEELPLIFPGGTKIEEIKRVGKCKAGIILGVCAGKSLVQLLTEKFGVAACQLPFPVGLKATDVFLETLAEITGKTIPARYRWERRLLLDAMIDAHVITYGKRVFIFGDDADLVLSLAGLAVELGMVVAVCAVGPPNEQFVRQGVAAESILNPVDFDELAQAARKTRLDILIGNSKGKFMAKEKNVPLLRFGFPIHDRLGAARQQIFGYRGAIQMVDLIANTILEDEDLFVSFS
ncbi:MAG: nitrogenase component 1 [Peptococcaceae bacterium]